MGNECGRCCASSSRYAKDNDESSSSASLLRGAASRRNDARRHTADLLLPENRMAFSEDDMYHLRNYAMQQKNLKGMDSRQRHLESQVAELHRLFDPSDREVTSPLSRLVKMNIHEEETTAETGNSASSSSELSPTQRSSPLPKGKKGDKMLAVPAGKKKYERLTRSDDEAIRQGRGRGNAKRASVLLPTGKTKSDLGKTGKTQTGTKKMKSGSSPTPSVSSSNVSALVASNLPKKTRSKYDGNARVRTLSGNESDRSQASDRSHASAGSPEAFAFRFYNYNMNMNGLFASASELQNPAGVGKFRLSTLFDKPLKDGRTVDVLFCTLTETQLNIDLWVQNQRHSNLALSKNRSSNVITTSAQRQCKRNEKAEATIEGDLNTVIVADDERFVEDRSMIYGRLAENKVRGNKSLPDPKKSFLGRALSLSNKSTGLRFLLLGVHFPIKQMEKCLENSDPNYVLNGVKETLADTLQAIMKKVAEDEKIDDQTIIIIQGNINSRTLLVDSGDKPRDALLELLADHDLQQQICEGLSIPPGKFKEICRFENALGLPVTYKFEASVRPQCNELKLEDVFKANPNGQRPKGYGRRDEKDISNRYSEILSRVFRDPLSKTWGLFFDPLDDKYHHFPAAADRVIYWAPDELADRLVWDPCCYSVNDGQLGSDHKPVYLEAVLKVAPDANNMMF